MRPQHGLGTEKSSVPWTDLEQRGGLDLPSPILSGCEFSRMMSRAPFVFDPRSRVVGSPLKGIELKL